MSNFQPLHITDVFISILLVYYVNICHGRFNRERDSGFVKIRNKLIGITAILIVILFIGIAMQSSIVGTQTGGKIVKNKNEPIQSLSVNSISYERLSASLNMNFELYVLTNHINIGKTTISKMNNNMKMDIINKFVSHNPTVLMELKELITAEEKSFNLQKPPSMKMYNFIIKHGNKTIESSKIYKQNNEIYKVSKIGYSIKINSTEYRETATIVQAPSGMKLIDPTVMVQINYLSHNFWWIGTITFGEVDYIYENYMYNAQWEVGYNYNEAYNLKNTFLQFSIGGAAVSTVLTTVIGLAASAIGDLGTVVSISTLAYDAADLGYAYGEISNAYGADSNCLPIAIQNDYIWDWYIGGLTGNGWGIHVYVDNNGWQQVLYPLSFSGFESPGISTFAHNFQSKYSSNWQWVGLYTN